MVADVRTGLAQYSGSQLGAGVNTYQVGPKRRAQLDLPRQKAIQVTPIRLSMLVSTIGTHYDINRNPRTISSTQQTAAPSRMDEDQAGQGTWI